MLIDTPGQGHYRVNVDALGLAVLYGTVLDVEQVFAAAQGCMSTLLETVKLQVYKELITGLPVQTVYQAFNKGWIYIFLPGKTN